MRNSRQSVLHSSVISAAVSRKYVTASGNAAREHTSAAAWSCSPVMADSSNLRLAVSMPVVLRIPEQGWTAEGFLATDQREFGDAWRYEAR